MILEKCSNHNQPRRFSLLMASQSTAYPLLTVFMLPASFALVAFGNLSSVRRPHKNNIAGLVMSQLWLICPLNQFCLHLTLKWPIARFCPIQQMRRIVGFYNESLAAMDGLVVTVNGAEGWKRSRYQRCRAGRWWLMVRLH